MVLLALANRPHFPALAGVGRGGPALLGPVGHLTTKDLFTKFLVAGGVSPTSPFRAAVPLCLGLATLTIAFLKLLATLSLGCLAGGLGVGSPLYAFCFSGVLKFCPDVARHAVPCLNLLADRGLPLLLLSLA